MRLIGPYDGHPDDRPSLSELDGVWPSGLTREESRAQVERYIASLPTPEPLPVCECGHTIDMHYPYALVGTPCDLCCCRDFLEVQP